MDDKKHGLSKGVAQIVRWMDGKLRRLAWQTLLLIIAALVHASLATTAAAHATSPSSGPRTQTYTETIQLSDAQCARIREAFPTASCTIEHTVTVTDSTSLTTSGAVTPMACPTGDLYFTDTYTNLPPIAYQLQISTHFHWWGDCGQPSGADGPYCQVNWSVVPYSDQRCYYWHSNEFNATEGKFTVFVGAVGVGYTAGIYRGCRPNKSCYSGWI